MDLRPFLGLLLATSLPLAAQEPIPLPVTPSPVPVAPPPQAPVERTPEQQVADLQKEKERLQKEIEYVKARVANSKTLLSEKFANRTLSVRTIDAGTSNIAAPAVAAPPIAPRHARLMHPDEASGHPKNILVVVNGNPITQESVDELVAYQRTPDDQRMRQMLAMMEMIRVQGIAAEFPDSDADVKLPDILAKLAEGKKVSELVKEHSTLKGADENGRLEVTRQSPFGLRIEQAAFTLEPGKASNPFRHREGVVLLQVESVEKGATPDLDKVIAHALLLPYTDDPSALQKAENMVMMSQLEILVRDKDVMQMLPPAFRDPEELRVENPLPVDGADELRLNEMLQEIGKEIERAQASGTDADKVRLPALEARYEKTKKELLRLQEARGGEGSGPK